MRFYQWRKSKIESAKPSCKIGNTVLQYPKTCKNPVKIDENFHDKNEHLCSRDYLPVLAVKLKQG